MLTDRTDHVRIVWSVPGHDHGELRCPRCPDVDVRVETYEAGAKAVNDHIATHQGDDDE